MLNTLYLKIFFLSIENVEIRANKTPFAESLNFLVYNPKKTTILKVIDCFREP